MENGREARGVPARRMPKDVRRLRVTPSSMGGGAAAAPAAPPPASAAAPASPTTALMMAVPAAAPTAGAAEAAADTSMYDEGTSPTIPRLFCACHQPDSAVSRMPTSSPCGKGQRFRVAVETEAEGPAQGRREQCQPHPPHTQQRHEVKSGGRMHAGRGHRHTYLMQGKLALVLGIPGGDCCGAKLGRSGITAERVHLDVLAGIQPRHQDHANVWVRAQLLQVPTQQREGRACKAQVWRRWWWWRKGGNSPALLPRSLPSCHPSPRSSPPLPFLSILSSIHTPHGGYSLLHVLSWRARRR
jgi:hypothetical protein